MRERPERNEALTGGLPAAFFDVDGTLASSNVVKAYLHFRIWRLPWWKRLVWYPFFLLRLPYYAVLDVLSRDRFNEVFFRHYAGVDKGELQGWAQEAVQRFWQPCLFPLGLEQWHRHRDQGHRVILVSGGIDLVLQPLARWLAADALVGAEMTVAGTSLTGRLATRPTSGRAKADATHQVAADLGIDLEQSYAYADSYSDRFFLSCVGHPVAVNPDWRLRRVARRAGWTICTWRYAKAASPTS